MQNAIKDAEPLRVLNAVAAGTTSQTGSTIDMEGYDGVLLIALIGTLTAGQVTSLKAQQSSDDGAADTYADLAGSNTGPMADGDSNKLLCLDIFRPQERYIKGVIVRGTQNAVIDGLLAIRYQASKRPTVLGTTVSASKVVVSPAEGTA